MGLTGGLPIDLEGYDATFDTTVILETGFHDNNNIYVSHPNKHKRKWKIVSTINVNYAPIQINWARNIASNYFSQQQLTCLELHHGLKSDGSSPVKYVVNCGAQPARDTGFSMGVTVE